MRSPTVIEFAETTISLEFYQNEKLISEDLFQKKFSKTQFCQGVNQTITYICKIMMEMVWRN